MDSQPLQPGEGGSGSTWLPAAASNTSLIGTQRECRHQLVHHEAANAAIKNMTQNAHLKITRKADSSQNKMLPAFWCEYIHNEGKVTNEPYNV